MRYDSSAPSLSLGGEVEEVTTTRTVVKRSPRGPAVLAVAAVLAAATAAGAAGARLLQRQLRKRGVLRIALRVDPGVGSLKVPGGGGAWEEGVGPTARGDNNDSRPGQDKDLAEAWLVRAAASNAGGSTPLLISARCRRSVLDRLQGCLGLQAV